MSLLKSGARVRCDAAGCMAETPLPVRLTTPQKSAGEDNAAGWLFVTSEVGVEHYCPACTTRYLAYSRYREEDGDGTGIKP